MLKRMKSLFIATGFLGCIAACFSPTEKEDEVNRISGQVLLPDGSPADKATLTFFWYKSCFFICSDEVVRETAVDNKGHYSMKIDSDALYVWLKVHWGDPYEDLEVRYLGPKHFSGDLKLAPFLAWDSQMAFVQEEGQVSVTYQPFSDVPEIDQISYEWALIASGKELSLFTKDDREVALWKGENAIPAWLLQDFLVKRVELTAFADRTAYGGYRLQWHGGAKPGFASASSAATSRNVPCYASSDGEVTNVSSADGITDGKLDAHLETLLAEWFACKLDFAQPVTTVAWYGAAVTVPDPSEEDVPDRFAIYLVESEEIPAPSQWGTPLTEVTREISGNFQANYGYIQTQTQSPSNWIVFVANEQKPFMYMPEIGVW